jgi:UDP-N-acetyl-D-mannosaminuronic acid dehydrogenase
MPEPSTLEARAGAPQPTHYDICVIGGLGRAGLPISLAFASRGQRVLIYDINEAAGKKLLSGVMPFLEDDGDRFLTDALQSGNLQVSHDIRDITKADVLVVIIGTPVDDHLNPKLDLMMQFLHQLLPHVRDGQYVLMRSTVFPGTTELVRDFFRKNGKNVRVTFCPERIAEGKAFKELFELPQIISGFSAEDVEAMRKLFGHIGAETIELSPIEAELGKLFTNVWRYCQFAVSNQFYMIANAYNMDFYRIYEAITRNYPRLNSMPAPGFAAGPCLFKDTLQLAAFNNNIFGLGYAAMTTNEGLPNHVVERLKLKVDLKDKTVGILGMAFKGNSDDKRGSLSFKLRRVLLWEANEVLCTDVYIQEPDFLSVDEVVRRSDVIILATPHREYKTLDLSGKIVVDVWNFYGKGGLIQI